MAEGRRSTLARRKQIMDAARKLIIRSGSEHVTIKNMAKEVGISDSAIYRHFKSKREILSFLADHVSAGLIHDIETARCLGSNSMSIIDEILRTHLSKIKQRRGLSFLVLAEIISFGNKSLNKKVSDSLQTYVGRLRVVLSDGVRAGVIRQDVDLDAAAFLLFGMIQGLVNAWALNSYKSDLLKRYLDIWGVCRRSLAY